VGRFMSYMYEDDRASYEAVRARVHEIKSFYSHVLVFLFINSILILENFLIMSHNLWFYYPLLAWGALLAVHALSTFGGALFFGRDWEEKKIQQMLTKERAGPKA
jgi:hypothetical protein